MISISTCTIEFFQQNRKESWKLREELWALFSWTRLYITIIFQYSIDMLWRWRSGLCFARNSWKLPWKSLRQYGSALKSSAGRIPLAYHKEMCDGFIKKNVKAANDMLIFSGIGRAHEGRHIIFIFWPMKYGYCGTLLLGNKSKEVLHCHDGLLLQVGGSQAVGLNYWKWSYDLPLKKKNLSDEKQFCVSKVQDRCQKMKIE